MTSSDYALKHDAACRLRRKGTGNGPETFKWECRPGCIFEIWRKVREEHNRRWARTYQKGKPLMPPGDEKARCRCPNGCGCGHGNSLPAAPLPDSEYTKSEYRFELQTVLKALGVNVAAKDKIDFRNVDGKIVFTVSHEEFNILR